MNKIYISVGCSNAGKSTYAKAMCAEDDNLIELNRDSVRFNYINPMAQTWDQYDYNMENEERVSEIIYQKFLNAVKLGNDVIISDTNLSYNTRNKWLAIASEFGYKVEFLVFNTAFETLFYRNSTRLENLSDYVIRTQYKRFTEFLESAPIPGVDYRSI